MSIAVTLLLGAVYIFEKGNTYYKVDSRLVNLANTDISKCKNFDQAYYNILVSHELRSASASPNQTITDSTNVFFMRDGDEGNIFQQSVLLLADQNYFSQLILRSKIFSNEVKPIVLYFQMDSECRVSDVMLVHESGTRSLRFDRTEGFRQLARDIIATVSEPHELRAMVNSRPDLVRGRALVRAFEGAEPARHLNLVGITYLVESNRRTAGSEEAIREAIGWFETALSHDPDFQPAILNLAKARARLSNHDIAIYGQQVDEILRNYYRSPKRGYLDAASSLLMDIVHSRKQHEMIGKFRKEIDQARLLAEAEVRKFGGSCALFSRLSVAYNYLAIIDSSPEHRRTSANYGFATNAMDGTFLCKATGSTVARSVADALPGPDTGR